MTEPAYSFSKGGRTLKLGEPAMTHFNLGATSSGVYGSPIPSLGSQPESKKPNSPVLQMHSRMEVKVKNAHLGPGTYPHADMMAKQALATRPNSPEARIGTGPRFSEHRRPHTVALADPGHVDPRKPPGSDQLAFSFSAPSRRHDFSRGLPTDKPMRMASPSPVMYNQRSAFGEQVAASKPTQPVVRVGKAVRDMEAKRYFSKQHERLNMGTFSKGQYIGQDSCIGPQKLSRHRTQGRPTFSVSDRFSELKPKHGRLPGPNGPGPGMYTI